MIFRDERAVVSRREWAAVLVTALIGVALTPLPYALGYELARPGIEFTGILMNPED